jgi:hypothetical protein
MNKKKRRRASIGDFLNLPIIEHIIINEEIYYSFTNTGLLKHIKDNSTYDLRFEKIDKLIEQMKQQEIALENTLKPVRRSSMLRLRTRRRSSKTIKQKPPRNY